MKYGICNLTLIPVRVNADHQHEMLSQLLFGECYKVIQANKNWLKIRCTFDHCEGWIAVNQHCEISKEEYQSLKKKPSLLSHQLVDLLEKLNDKSVVTLLLGSSLPNCNQGKISFNQTQYHLANQPEVKDGSKEGIVSTAFMYENAPFLWGGRSPFGIDAAGFTQMVYKLNGYSLKRVAAEQALQGEVLSFIEESEPGDLAFFDDDEGNIIHVGILLKNHHIIHVDGKVRVDMLDQSGIFNPITKKHTHKLRVIKKII